MLLSHAFVAKQQLGRSLRSHGGPTCVPEAVLRGAELRVGQGGDGERSGAAEKWGSCLYCRPAAAVCGGGWNHSTALHSPLWRIPTKPPT